MEIGHGRSGRRHDRHGGLTAARTQTACQTEGEEGGVALIDAHMSADEPRLGEWSQGIDQGRGPRTGGEDDITDPGIDQASGNLLRHRARIRHHLIFNHLTTWGSPLPSNLEKCAAR